MSLLLSLLLSTLSGPRPVEGPATQRTLILPLRVPQQLSDDDREFVHQVEELFVASLVLHTVCPVVTYHDVESQLTQATLSQLEGCVGSACVKHLSQLLDVQHLVLVTVLRQLATWELDAVILERNTGHVLKRVEARSRSKAALLSSVGQLSRDLTRDVEYSLADPELKNRLGTDAAGMSALRSHIDRTQDGSITHAWTRVLLDRNRESAVLPLVQGGLMVTAGITGSALAVAPGMAMAAFIAGSAQFEGDVRFPLLPMAASVALVMAAVPLLICIVAALAGVAVLDAVDVGRVTVSKDGCCRDDRTLREAARPRPVDRLAVGSALLGSSVLLLAPLMASAAFGSFALGILLSGMLGADNAPVGPAIVYPTELAASVAFSVFLVAVLSSPAAMALQLLVISMLGQLLAGALAATEGSPLVD